MKTPLETGRRWLAQAEYSLEVTHFLMKESFWANACFHSEQTSKIAFKAFLYANGRRYVQIHSVRELASECGKEHAAFLEFLDPGSSLDRYYLSTRYPDALPAPALPFESFAESEAAQAVNYATEIVELVKATIPKELDGAQTQIR